MSHIGFRRELMVCFNFYEFTEVNLQHGINEIAIDGQT